MSFFDDHNFHTFVTRLLKYHMGVFMRVQPLILVLSPINWPSQS